MEFIPIFDKNYPREECILWSVKYNSDELHELDRLFYLWSDPMFLRAFFKNNEAKLNTEFWSPMSIREAVLKVMDEANSFDQKLIELEDNAQENDFDLIYSIFKTLHKTETSIRLPIELKGKPPKPPFHKPLLRLYGLQLEGNRILITGGGIKLTESMDECDLLRGEEKIKNGKRILKRK